MKLIAELKLAMARINPVHIEGGKADPWEFIGDFFPREEEGIAGVWVEKEKGVLEGSLARQEGSKRVVLAPQLTENGNIGLRMIQQLFRRQFKRGVMFSSVMYGLVKLRLASFNFEDYAKNEIKMMGRYETVLIG